MSYEKIIYEKKDGVGIITFNSPENRNAMSKQFMKEMHICMDEARYDDEVKVLILTGGAKWFASGIDLKEAQHDPMTRKEAHIGLKAKELLFIGENIDVQEAYRIGLVNKITSVDSLMDEAMALAKKIASLSAPAVQLCKFLVNKGLKTDLDTALDYDEYVCTFDNMGTPEQRLDAIKKAAEKYKVYDKIFHDSLK
ncbi:MAG: enoyl-CoA hydratase/isomerase family protein [Chloroflexi bacterium]|nr:enoyl-CoA hydratase/isomerase family protein [Chloroflexota bacterium]